MRALAPEVRLLLNLLQNLFFRSLACGQSRPIGRASVLGFLPLAENPARRTHKADPLRSVHEAPLESSIVSRSRQHEKAQPKASRGHLLDWYLLSGQRFAGGCVLFFCIARRRRGCGRIDFNVCRIPAVVCEQPRALRTTRTNQSEPKVLNHKPMETR